MLPTHNTLRDVPATRSDDALTDGLELLSPSAEDTLELFRPEAAPGRAVGRSIRPSALTEGGLGTATPRQERSSRSSPRQLQPGPTGELRFAHPSYEPTTLNRRSRRAALPSLVRSPAFVWLLLGAPVAGFLGAWLLANAETVRRTTSDAGNRVRATIAPMLAHTSHAVQSDRRPAPGPPSAADGLESVPPAPSKHNDDSTRPEPTERGARPTRSVDGSSRPPALASAMDGASPRATKERLAGALSIDSRPVGASVFIDGQLIGTTPMLLPQISPGTHAIRLQLTAHRDWESTIDVAPDRRNRVTAALEESEPPEP